MKKVNVFRYADILAGINLFMLWSFRYPSRRLSIQQTSLQRNRHQRNRHQRNPRNS